MISTCGNCPEHSDSTEANSSLANFGKDKGCKCKEKYYACNPKEEACEENPHCLPCPIYMKTLKPGETDLTACRCEDDGETLVVMVGNVCGCPNFEFFDEAAYASGTLLNLCKPCSRGQACFYYEKGSPNANASLSPPRILPGFWAVWPVVVEHFSGHIVYECQLAVCLQEPNRQCTQGREGVACSQCLPRHFGTPVGVCQPCAGTATNMRIRVVLIALLCIPGFAMFHFFVKMTSEGNTSNLSVRAIKMSLRQWVKYFQTLKIVAVFHVSWPQMPRDFFDSAVLGLFSFGNYNGPLAVGCLGSRQTVQLDMAFRWSLAPFIAIASLFGMFFSQVVSMICKLIPHERVKQFGRLFGFGFLGAIKTFYVITTFFFTALMQSGFMVMMCRSNPTEATGMSVVDYPHITCDSDVWFELLPLMMLYLFAVGIVFLCLGVYICKQQAVHLGLTSLKSRGPWTLISQDFRATHLYWPLVLQIKDIILNVIAAAFGILGDGMLQLVFAGGLALAYAIFTLVEQPTLVFSCGVNEVWMSMSIFATIFMIAATGLQQSKGGENPDSVFEEAKEEYELREHLMLVVLIAGFAGPCAVFVVQLLLLRPVSSRLLPKLLKPFDDEGRQAHTNTLQSLLNEAAKLDGIMHKFDACDFKKFNNLLRCSSATVGLLEPHQKRFTPAAILRNTLVKNAPAVSSGGGADRSRDAGATISV